MEEMGLDPNGNGRNGFWTKCLMAKMEIGPSGIGPNGWQSGNSPIAVIVVDHCFRHICS